MWHSSRNCGAAASSLITRFSAVGGLQDASATSLVPKAALSLVLTRGEKKHQDQSCPTWVLMQKYWARLLLTITMAQGEVGSVAMPHSFWRSMLGTPGSSRLCDGKIRCSLCHHGLTSDYLQGAVLVGLDLGTRVVLDCQGSWESTSSTVTSLEGALDFFMSFSWLL